MLALDGYDVVALDRDQRRYAAMLSMLEVLRADAPDARARIETRLGSFPDALERGDDVANDAVLAIGCTFTADAACCRAFEEALKRFHLGVIDFARLFTEASNDDAWRQRATEFGGRLNMSVRSCGPYRIPEEDRQGELFVIEGITAHMSRDPEARAWTLSPRFRPEGPKGWVASLPADLHRLTDSNDHPRVSRLRLVEEGRRLGPAHSDHNSIRTMGGGRYSCWTSVVYIPYVRWQRSDIQRQNLHHRTAVARRTS